MTFVQHNGSITSAATVAPAQGRVKALVWTGEFWNEAQTPFCLYSVVEVGDERWKWSRSEYPYHFDSDPDFKTEDDAKAAAQADFEARILSAFEVPPGDDVTSSDAQAKKARDYSDLGMTPTQGADFESMCAAQDAERLRLEVERLTIEAASWKNAAKILEAERDAANARADRVSEALQFYANWPETDDVDVYEINDDRGAVARAALTQEGE